MGSLSMFMNLPMPVKAAIFVATGGGIMGLMFFLSSAGLFGNALSYLLLIAMAVAALIFGIYKFVSKKMGKRKAKPFEQKMADSASATPSGVSDPGSRAQLDDLRRRFEEGISVFKEHGKDLYTMPWYVIVGEPGSGKTEAMRHSNVGFPPGLQDQLQGVGGTVNMHWWFTNHAVMIDTAGRLMFEDIEPGQTSEWAEFLKMLRTARPNCPLNGMLLVIPADSLIKDSANDIERKGGKIAQQLDNIQRALGVRFPVYIVISKADRINGFREFFEELTDPVMQMQMMGWTNPTDLDTPFDPSMVEQHLTNVRERLVRRRFSLLADPVNSDDPMGRRVDQVDALYSFPDSLVKLAPRLRRYLEMVFVAGEWSQKPLFLRGIYFTSSMREGDALDSDLAEVLGVQVDALKEGKLWERDRSYFLKDVFMEKVFREKGLVTRESNVGKSRRRQSTILVLSGLALAIGIGFWTYYSYTKLRDSIGAPSEDWGTIAKLVADDLSGPKARQSDPSIALVQPRTGRYMDATNNPDKPGEVGEWTRVKVQEEAARYAERVEAGELKTDFIFKFVAAATGSVFADIPVAQQILFDRYVLLPFVDEARRRIGDPSINTAGDAYANWRELLVAAGRDGPSPRDPVTAWSPAAIDALVALLEIQSAGLNANKKYTAADFDRWLGAFSHYPTQQNEDRRFRTPDEAGVAQNNWDKFSPEHQAFLVDQMVRRFGQGGTGKIEEVFRTDEPYAIGAADAGVQSFVKTWTGGDGGQTGLLGKLEQFTLLGGEYRRLEDAVTAYSEIGTASTSEQFEQARTEWVKRVKALGDKRAELEALLARPVVTSATDTGTPPTLLEVMTRGSERIQTDAKALVSSEADAVFRRLLNAIPAGIEETEGRAGALAELRRSIEDRRAAFDAELEQKVDRAMAALNGTGAGTGLLAELIDPSAPRPAYLVRFETIDRAATQIQEPQAQSVDLTTFAGVVEQFKTAVGTGWLPSTDGEGVSPLSKRAVAISGGAINAYRSYILSGWTLQTLRALSDKSLETMVTNRREALPAGERSPDFDLSGIPLTNNERVALMPQFDEKIAGNILKSIEVLRQAATDGSNTMDSERIAQLLDGVGDRLRDYRTGYITYWTKTVPGMYRPVLKGEGADAWSRVQKTLDDLDEEALYQSLLEVTERSARALEGIAGVAGAADSSIDAYVAQLKNDKSGLLFAAGAARDQLRNRAGHVRIQWQNLDNGSVGAWNDLTRQLSSESFNEDQFKRKYFVVVGPVVMTPALNYWSGFPEVMLRALKQSVGGEEVIKRDELRALRRGFPLVRDGVDEMSITDFEAAKRLVEWLSERSASSSAAGREPRRVSGLEQSVNEELEAVQRGAAANEAQLSLVEKLSAAVKAIEGTKTLTFSLPPRALNESFTNDHQFVQVLRNGQPISGLQNNGVWDTTDTKPKDLMSLPVPDVSGGLEFRFWSVEKDFTDGQEPKAVGVLSGSWYGLRALSVEPEADGFRLVPLQMQTGIGVYHIRVTGLEGDMSGWPTAADWTRAK